MEFAHILASLNNHGLPETVTRFQQELVIQHHAATVTRNGVARDSAPDLMAHHSRLCCGDRWAAGRESRSGRNVSSVRSGQPLLDERCDCLREKHASSLCALEAGPTTRR